MSVSSSSFLLNQYLRDISFVLLLYLLILAVQDNSNGDIDTDSLSQTFDFSDFKEHCKAVVDPCDLSDGD